MSPQETSITHSALGWVKKSIDDNLSEIKADLRRYIENGDEALLDGVKQRLKMIQGVLVMIEQYGAAMLTEEMVALADFITDNREERGEQAMEVLLRAVLQLPDYLEHIQSGHRDIPIAILPLLNDIRAVRNQDLFSEKLLFLPDLSMHEQAAGSESIDNDSNQASRLLAKKLRPIYQLALVNVIRDKAVEESLQRLEKVCATLEERSASEQVARIWWIIGALIESVSRQQLELGVSIKNLLGKVDALFRVILIIGEGGLLKRQPIELIKNFLYYIAQPECDGPKTQAIKTAYRLEQFLPSESARSEVLNNIAGPNQALLKTVAEAMRADIETVKSALEVYVNGDLAKVDTLKDLPQEMHIISDTLAMIGLGSQRQLIEAQIEVVKQIVAGKRAADEEQLLSMAAELLQVEQALDQMQKRQPVDSEQAPSESDVSRDYELDSVLSAVVSAALDDVQKTKNAIIEFVKDPERGDNIDLCITLMRESRGALMLLEQERAVAVVDGLLAYLQDYDTAAFMESQQLDDLSQVVASLEYYLEALGERRSDASSILDFADARLRQLLKKTKRKLAGVAVAEPAAGGAEVASDEDEDSRSTLEDTLVVASPASAQEPGEADAPTQRIDIAAIAQTDQASEPALDDTVVVTASERAGRQIDADAPTQVMPFAEDARADQVPASDLEDTIVVSAAERGAMQTDADAPTLVMRSAAKEDVSAADVKNWPDIAPVEEDLEVLKSGSDPDILDIYLEEAAEETENIARLQQDWMLHPEDENALKNIRRAFHTIKGSGRLVGATKIGEFAWDFEQLLNRVIDKTVPPSKQVINAVGGAARALPELVNELKTFEEPRADIAYLRGMARALAEFNTEQLLIDHTQTLTFGESPYDHITDSDSPDGDAGESAEGEGIDLGFGATTQIIESGGPRAQPPNEAESAPLDTVEVPPEPEPEAELPDEIVPAILLEEPSAETAADQAQSGLSNEMIPDSPQVDTAAEEPAAVFAKSATDNDTRDSNDFSETMLTEPPPVPNMDERRRAEARARADIAVQARARAESSYRRAVDYSRVSTDSEDSEDDAFASAGEKIEIESMGDDFIGEGEGIDHAEQMAVESMASLAAVSDSEQLQADEPELAGVAEASEIASESFEVVEAESEAAEEEAEEITMQSAVEEEAEEITMQSAAEEEAEEITMQSAAEEEAEEITMQSAAEEEAEEITMQSAAEVEAQEIKVQSEAEAQADNGLEFETLDPDFVDDQAKALQGDAENSSNDEHTQQRRAPPDPFVPTMVDSTSAAEVEGSESRVPAQPEPTGLSFDPELLTIYRQEVEQHLDIVNSVLDHAETIGELIPNEEIYRALHTIHGASRTADIGAIGELAGLLEKPLKSAIAQKLALDHEIIALYREGQRALQEMTTHLVATRQMPVISEDLRISLRALAEDFEEHTVDLSNEDSGQSGDFIDTLTMMNENSEPDQDRELLEIFIDEANELLEMSDSTLHQWSQQDTDEPGPQDYNAVMELQRYLHTLKGGARMAELKHISDLSHEMESLFIAVIDGRVDRTDGLMELLRDAFDRLHRQVSQAQRGEEMTAAGDMIAALRDLRSGSAENVSGVAPDASAELDPDSENIDIVSENLPGEPLSGAYRSAQDVIKVRAELLDNLVSSAGEVSIYRARMEQQVAGLGSHLGELGQTIARLKSQLRSLEAETDAQIHFSHRAENRRGGEFDPLEMDRYTMIQELSRSLSESVNDLSSLQSMLGEQVRDSETLLLQQSRVSTDLQDGLIKSRMVRFSGLLTRLRRLVRQSSQELGKKAELVVTGEQTEVDNKVLDRMVAPLEHIIRNALSHGIETPMERVKKGKPESGRITIDINRDGSDVVIRVSDDGAGVDIEKVRSRAIQQGLLKQGQEASDSDLVQYILEPGFSTAEHVTQLSGRGVGMDVVDIEVKQLGGTLQIETTPQGTTFIARLPFTLSINQAILVRCGDETYAIPLLNIEGITRIDAQQMHEYYRQQAPELDYAGQVFALRNLAELVGADGLFKPGVEEKQAVILSRSGDTRVALHVDEIIGNREIVVKNLGKQLAQVKSLAGASILADGSMVLILDIGGLMRHSIDSSVKVIYQAADQKPPRLRDKVMVVDDSITMRRVASKLLERHNYEVITAKDGVDALARLQDVLPDVVLLDVEMPRMDGFELATHMQNEASFSEIPIIMITSRTGEKHRDRALEIGVTNYMGKPYQEDELIENIQSALGGR